MQVWIITVVPVGIGSSLHPHNLVHCTILLSLFQLLLVVLNHFPPFIFSLEYFHPLPLELRLPPVFLIVSPIAFIACEVFLEALQGYFKTRLPSIWWVGASWACKRLAAPVPSSSKYHYVSSYSQASVINHASVHTLRPYVINITPRWRINCISALQ
jgi:hypothetical protein